MFESLDFLYIPAPNIQESIKYYTKVLNGELLWKIHAYGVWVVCVKLSDKEPYILLADHMEKKDPMLIYRVNNLEFPLTSNGHLLDTSLFYRRPYFFLRAIFVTSFTTPCSAS